MVPGFQAEQAVAVSIRGPRRPGQARLNFVWRRRQEMPTVSVFVPGSRPRDLDFVTLGGSLGPEKGGTNGRRTAFFRCFERGTAARVRRQWGSSAGRWAPRWNRPARSEPLKMCFSLGLGLLLGGFVGVPAMAGDEPVVARKPGIEHARSLPVASRSRAHGRTGREILEIVRDAGHRERRVRHAGGSGVVRSIPARRVPASGRWPDVQLAALARVCSVGSGRAICSPIDRAPEPASSPRRERSGTAYGRGFDPQRSA